MEADAVTEPGARPWRATTNLIAAFIEDRTTDKVTFGKWDSTT